MRLKILGQGKIRNTALNNRFFGKQIKWHFKYSSGNFVKQNICITAT